MRIFLLLSLTLSLLQTGLRAQTASLSSSTLTPVAGEPFLLTLKAEGRSVQSPDILDIPGIDVLSRSQSSSVSFINGRMSTRTAFNFKVVARKEGELTIPGIDLNINGKAVKTNAAKLNVQKGSGIPQPRLSPGIPTPPGFGGPSPNTSSNVPAFPSKIDGKAAFLKVVPSREAIYVGETVEVEIKAYLDAGMPIVNFSRDLSLTGEDFIFQPPIGPDVERRRRGGRQFYAMKQETIDGRRFNVLTYKATMTAVKPGKFTLAPVDFASVIQLPREQRQRRRPRSPLDSIFGGDPFDDPIFDMMNSRKQEIRLRSKEVEVEVLPLPTEGRPDHFSGAIGRFSMEVKADKKALKVDEALSLTATLTGYGNFERISELDRSGDSNWKSYPPNIEFNSADDLKLGGQKAFEYTFIAVEPGNEAPLIQFCYFDPKLKEYVNLSGDQIPVSVTGMAASSLSNQDLAAMADQVAADPGQTILAAAPASSRLAFSQGSQSSWLGTVPLLAINGVAALLALGLVGWQWRRGEHQLSPEKQHRLLVSEEERLFGQLRQASNATELDAKLQRWLAVWHHVSHRERMGLEDSEAAYSMVRALPPSESKNSLEDFLSWSSARHWSSGLGSKDDEILDRRQKWIQAAETQRTVWLAA